MDSRRIGWTVMGFALCAALVPAHAADIEPATQAPAGTPAEHQDFKVEVSPPRPGSARAQALVALDKAERLTLYSLQPWQPPEAPGAWSKLRPSERSRRVEKLNERSRREWCQAHECLDGNRVLGRVEVGAADRAPVFQALRDSFAKVPNFGFACGAQYRHAVGFFDAGQHYEALLCYHCAQVKIRVDGKDRSGDEQAYEMGDLGAINAILTRAGVPLSEGEKR